MQILKSQTLHSLAISFTLKCLINHCSFSFLMWAWGGKRRGPLYDINNLHLMYVEGVPAGFVLMVCPALDASLLQNPSEILNGPLQISFRCPMNAISHLTQTQMAYFINWPAQQSSSASHRCCRCFSVTHINSDCQNATRIVFVTMTAFHTFDMVYMV